MYTICESLAAMAQDLGRMKAFAAGWLENQSVWPHMSYKFYLELLRGGMYDVFFNEIKTGLIPFMDNAVYGRSPLEASSFIASSAFPDPKLHGMGFLSRLSGSTAEFLSMWVHMMAGPMPFQMSSDNKLVLALSPVLPSWLFSVPDNTVSFVFLGSVKVTYFNSQRLDTWTAQPTSSNVVFKDGTSIAFSGAVIDDSVTAIRIRNGEAVSIAVHY
jgi:hypothetical protein